MSQVVGLRTKLPMMIAAFLFSLFLWLVVQSTQPRAPRVLDVPLRTQNLGAGYVVTNMPEDVQVRIDGTEEQLRNIKPSSVFGVVDLGKATPGRRGYPVRLVYSSDLPVIPDLLERSVMVETEAVVKRNIPVFIEPIGQLPPGSSLVFDDAVADPAMVEVEGPRSLVMQAERARGFLDLAEVTESDREITVTLEVLGPNNRPMTDVELSEYVVKARPILEAATESKTVPISPTFTGLPASGYIIRGFDVNPKRVAVQGNSVAVARMATLTTPPISIDGIKNTRVFTVDLDAPIGVQILGRRRAQVRVIVEPSGTTTSRG